MAYDTLNLDGTTVAPGGIVPFGALKDAPSGTRVNTKMLGDIWQMMQQMLDGAGITANNLPDNDTNGYQFTEALSKVIGNHAAQIVVGLLGATYDPTKVYIIWGCATRADSGFAMYDGQLYYITGNSGSACGGGLVDTIAVYNPTLYTDGVQALQITCGASGSGISDFADVIYVNEWRPVNGTVFSGIGITVDPGDVIFNRYTQTGNTINYQLRLNGVTIGAGAANMQISLPFVPTSLVNTGFYQICGWSPTEGVLVAIFSANDIFVQKVDSTNFDDYPFTFQSGRVNIGSKVWCQIMNSSGSSDNDAARTIQFFIGAHGYIG
jgi:hypothetical protein